MSIVEAFSARLGAELSYAQHDLRPAGFAHLVTTLGIGRAKVDRLMACARLREATPPEARPSAWTVIFGRLEPLPMLPDEVATIEAVEVAPEPPEYRRRADLLSADGLVALLVTMHGRDALAIEAEAALRRWVDGRGSSTADRRWLRQWKRGDRGQESG